MLSTTLSLIDSGADRVRAMSALIERLSSEMVGRAYAIGERLYAAKPKSIGGEMAEYWRARMDEIAADATAAHAD